MPAADPDTGAVCVSFDRFMHWALYHPDEGYYAACGGGPAGPFGSQGDFITAPALGPWLSGALAKAFIEIAERAQEPEQLVIRELGAGNGRLAADLLTALQACDRLPSRYEIFEPSPAMRLLQANRLQSLPAPLAERVRWIDRMDTMQGLILANEVADALPVKVFEWRGGDSDVYEWGICLADGEMTWARWPAPAPLRQVVQRRRDAQQARGLGWGLGHRGEWCPALTDWARMLGASLDFGELVVLDYGYEQYELDHPDRSGGTLAAHHRHRRIDDWQEIIAQPGRQDLTAHVDFTTIAEALATLGLDLRLQSQAAWLLDHDVLSQAKTLLFDNSDGAPGPPVARHSLQALSGLQTLLSDGAMGQSFLVLSARRGFASL